MTNKYNLQVGDLLLRNSEMGIVRSISETPYGLIFNVYWAWADTCGSTIIPQQLLCKAFFKKFIHIKATAKNKSREAYENR